MVWATVSSWSCFCWLYRASPSLAAKNIINLILVLAIWWYPCVESSLVLLEEGVCYDQCNPLANSISLCLASFCIPRPNLPVTPSVSWLPTFAFQSRINKDITRWSTPISDWLYSLQPKMEKLYTVSKNKTRSWLWLRPWTSYCQIQTSIEESRENH